MPLVASSQPSSALGSLAANAKSIAAAKPPASVVPDKNPSERSTSPGSATRNPDFYSTFGFLPRISAKLKQQLKTNGGRSEIIRPSAFGSSALTDAKADEPSASSPTSTGDGGEVGDMIVAISPKFAMTPIRKSAQPVGNSAAAAAAVAPLPQQSNTNKISDDDWRPSPLSMSATVIKESSPSQSQPPKWTISCVSEG